MCVHITESLNIAEKKNIHNNTRTLSIAQTRFRNEPKSREKKIEEEKKEEVA